jgi:hypothetical protein
MPELDLEPHEYRPKGRLRLWGRRMVLQMAALCLAIVVGATWAMVSRRDAPWEVFALFAMFTWPWLIIIGAAIGYLAPGFFFQDDKQD